MEVEDGDLRFYFIQYQRSGWGRKLRITFHHYSVSKKWEVGYKRMTYFLSLSGVGEVGGVEDGDFDSSCFVFFISSSCFKLS